jgi:modulator of FtsH protease
VPPAAGFTFFMGLMLSRLLGDGAGLQGQRRQLVMMAFAGTGGDVLRHGFAASVIKRDLSGMGKFLFIGAMMLLVAGIANVFIQSAR